MSSHTDALAAAYNAVSESMGSDEFKARIAELERERGEADRRAGAAERRMEDLVETQRKQQWWMDDRKKELGYGLAVPFDTVWADTLAKARSAEALSATVERLREGLRWYEAAVAGCRKLGPDGDKARAALDKDGGKLASTLLNTDQTNG